MSTSQEKLPLILWNGLRMVRAVKLFGRARAPKAEGSGVARIAQDFERRAVEQRSPVDLAFMRAGAHPARKEESLVAKISHGPPGRPDSFEGREQETDGLLDLRIRIQDYAPVLCIEQADRQRDL